MWGGALIMHCRGVFSESNNKRRSMQVVGCATAQTVKTSSIIAHALPIRPPVERSNGHTVPQLS